MEWWLVLLLMLGGMSVLMLAGLPVAFAFLTIDAVGAWLFLGGEAGLKQLVLNIEESISTFSILPVPLFILMGEIMFGSRLGARAVDAIEHWIGRIPGRLSLLTIVGGSLFSTMSGSTVATTALLGSQLVPEMERRGYSRAMSIGPILGSGGLAMMIPPSALAILLAAVANISVGGLLIAGIVPGLLMALFYCLYVVLRCLIQPEIAPAYDVARVPLTVRLRAFAVHILPLGLIVFLVIGLIFLGVATPSESAALGALGSILLAWALRSMSWRILIAAILGATKLTAMMFLIIVASMTFSQILAFSGASAGFISLIERLDLGPVPLLVCMMLVLLVLGCFMDSLSMVMIALPIFLPLVTALHIDPLWFGVLLLINMQMGNTTPPFGLLLFVMKGVAPADTTMREIYLAALPFLACDTVVMALIMAFPGLALFPVALMH